MDMRHLVNVLTWSKVTVQITLKVGVMHFRPMTSTITIPVTNSQERDT